MSSGYPRTKPEFEGRQQARIKLGTSFLHCTGHSCRLLSVNCFATLLAGHCRFFWIAQAQHLINSTGVLSYKQITSWLGSCPQFKTKVPVDDVERLLPSLGIGSFSFDKSIQQQPGYQRIAPRIRLKKNNPTWMVFHLMESYCESLISERIQQDDGLILANELKKLMRKPLPITITTRITIFLPGDLY